MSTRDASAEWMPSPNFWNGRLGYTPKYIIIHGTAGGSNGSSAVYLCQPSTQASAHYVITQAGKVYQLVDEEFSAWGNGIITAGHDPWWSINTNPNLITISIEHEKPDDANATALTDAQTLASLQLVARICQRWNIPMSRADANGGITGHYSLDPVNRARCPGNYPWSDLFAYLATQQNHGDIEMLQLTDPMGRFFTQTAVDSQGNAIRWHCASTNVDVGYAHLDFMRRCGGVLGLPLTNEMSVPGLQGVAVQCYERGIAIYDPKHQNEGSNPATNIFPGSPVYLLRIDRGIGAQIIAKPLITELQAQIAQLQAQIHAMPDATVLQNKVTAYQQAMTQVQAIIAAVK